MPLIPEVASDYHPESVCPVTPEKRLLAAILERVIMDIICSYQNSVLRIAALEYLHETPIYSTFYPPFSYPWICQGLGIDPEDTRAKILGIDYIPSKNRKSSYRSMIY